MKVLSNNRDLHEYLLLLESVLEERGATALSEIVQFAARFASTIPATKFMGEPGRRKRHLERRGTNGFV